MNHDAILDLIDQERDGVLAAADCERLAGHLRACADCAAYRRAAAGVGTLLAAEAAAAPSAAFVARVMAALPAEERGGWFEFAWAPAAAAVLAAFMFLLTPEASSNGMPLSPEEPLLAQAGPNVDFEDLLGVAVEER